MKPLIGVTGNLLREQPNRDWSYISNDYFEAVQHAGGIPVLLPWVDSEEEAAAVLAKLGGLLLSGGNDIDPQVYGEHPHPKNGGVSPERDLAELAYAKVALSQNLPTLGICRGHQLLAVACGGTLWQDIPAQVPGAIKHSQEGPRWFASHSVKALAGTRIADLLGTEFKVNTYHHQAVKDLPAGFVASATAPDGINEAMENPTYKFCLSVQWHPENFTARAYHFGTLFQAFISACK